jgi:hypothetical protein
MAAACRPVLDARLCKPRARDGVYTRPKIGQTEYQRQSWFSAAAHEQSATGTLTVQRAAGFGTPAASPMCDRVRFATKLVRTIHSSHIKLLKLLKTPEVAPKRRGTQNEKRRPAS